MKMKLLIVLLPLIALSSIASAQFNYDLYWGSFGNEDGQFYGMSGVSRDSSSNIYVTELDNRVQKFNPQGQYITQFNIPARMIAIDSSDNIYATVNDTIKKYDSSGNFIASYGSTGTGNGQFNLPIGIALDSFGNIYVVDCNNNRIQKLDSSGNYITQWGSFGTSNVQFNSPIDIEFDDGYLYISDTGNSQIKKFDTSGNFISSFGSTESLKNQFNGILGISIDNQHNIYVADYYNNRVLQYDSNWNYLAQYIGFSNPTDVVATNTNLYVLDSTNYSVIAFDVSTLILPVANFSTNVTEGYAPLSVQFNDLSENATSVNWDFDDGNNSTERNPVYEFTTAGTYTVNLTASNENGTNSKLDTITVLEPESSVLPVASFSANPTDGNAPLTVQFTDTSTNSLTGWEWNFGDGQTSTAQNPSHMYYSPGTYTVSLNVSNADGYNISAKPNLITVTTTAGPVTNGLIVYYNGNLSGKSLVDLSGNNNTGYATNVTQETNQSTDVNYISLGGVNSKIDVSNNDQTNISSPISIEFIGSINTFSKYGALVSKYRGSAAGSWYLSCSSAAPYNHARFGAILKDIGLKFYESNVGLVAGQVYDIVATYDNNVTHIYINGVDSDSRTWNSPIAGNTSNISIGYGSGLNYSNCSMYTFRLYNRSLSPAEVLQNYNTIKPIPTVIWSNPANITYGTGLDGTQLNAVATDPVTGNTVTGNFTYIPVAGTILGVGAHTLHADFTPTDTANYTNATADVSINVSEKTVLPVANFTANISQGFAPLAVQFNDSSENADTVSWDFNGDGISDSQDRNPVHEFTTPGIYTVNLTVINENGTNSTSATINVMKSTPTVTTGLVISYDGNITSGKLIDMSGNSNTGYVIGATQGTLLTTGANYVSFDGVKNRVNILSNASTNITKNLSVEFIGNISTFNKYGILVHKYQSNVGGWYISTSQTAPYNTIRFGFVGTDASFHSYVSNIQLTESQYYHIVVTYDGTAAHIYVDSVDSEGSNNFAVPIAASSINTSLYYSPSVFNNTKGNLLLFRMYNHTLTQAEVRQNYENNRWRYLSTIPDYNIINIQKKAYGNGGLPFYMGNYAVQKQSDGLYVISDSLSRVCIVTAPYHQDYGGSKTNATLLSYNITGVKWKNYYAPGSTIALNYTGTNRSIHQIGTLSNNAFDLTNTVNYTGSVLSVIDGVNVTGNGNYHMYGDGIATISGDVVKSLTDDATVQTNILFNSTGGAIYTNYQRRDAGISRTNDIEIVLSSPQLTPMLAPSGYLGALMFANHPDYSSTNSLKAVMYGTNNSSDPAYGKKGFVGHGLVCTWGTFAATTSAGEGFDSPAFKTVIDDMYQHGFEITPHNVWGRVGYDLPNRTITAKYLPWYTANYSNRNWIDHGLGNGARNTGLKSLGWGPTSEYYIMDLLKDNGIIYAWSFDDYSPSVGLNMVHIPYAGMPADVVWQNTNLNLSDGTPIYQWRSEATGSLVGLNYYNNKTVNDLINAYGVNIWHGYWSDTSDGFKDYYYHRGPPATINETFDGFLTYLSTRNTAGDLWNPTVAQFIDYFRQVENVSIKCTGKNTYTVVNNNPTTVSGYALRVSGLYTPKLDGVTLSKKTSGTDTIFWMNLSEGTHIITLEVV